MIAQMLSIGGEGTSDLENLFSNAHSHAASFIEIYPLSKQMLTHNGQMTGVDRRPANIMPPPLLSAEAEKWSPQSTAMVNYHFKCSQKVREDLQFFR